MYKRPIIYTRDLCICRKDLHICKRTLSISCSTPTFWGTHEWVTTRVNELCHTYEWVVSHIWMSHVKHMNESCHIVTSHSYMWHDSFIYLTCLIRIHDMTHSYVWHDSFECVTWLCDIYMSDVTHSYLLQRTIWWLIHTCEINHSWMGHENAYSICVF